MSHILLVPVNDLLYHYIPTRFAFIAKRLSEDYGARISMLRYDGLPTDSQSIMEKRLKVEPITFPSIKSRDISFYYLLNIYNVYSTLSKYLRTHDVDAIIHANVLPSTIAVKLGKASNVPLIFDYQDHFPESAAAYYRRDFLKALTYSIVARLTKFNIRHSDVIVTVTDYLKRVIERFDSTKRPIVIPNGVDTDLFRYIPKSEALKKLGMEELLEKPILIYFGSIDPWVDFRTPFKVLKRLANRGIDVRFFIIGVSHSGYYLKETKRAARSIGIEDQVYFFEPVSQGQLVYYINAADISIVPLKDLSKNQAVPLKLLESLACGKVIFVTRIPEIINRFGHVVYPYTSDQELESNILKVIRGQIHVPLKEMKEIAERYSWDAIAAKYHKVIQLTVSGSI